MQCQICGKGNELINTFCISCGNKLKYNVENIEYKSKLDVSSCKYSNGDKVMIYYDKNNPSNFVSNSIAILIFATLFTGSGLVIFIVKWIKSSNRKKKIVINTN